MKVGIDINATIYGRGVSRYTANLVRALIEHTDLELSLFGSSLRQHRQLTEQLKSFSRLAQRQHRPLTTTSKRIPPSALAQLWRLGLLPMTSMLPAIEVFHSWDWLQPPDRQLPLVSTIHDLAIIKYPQTAHPKILAMHQASWRVLKQRQAHIIAVSQATKRDIVELLQISPKLIQVVYEALPQETVSAMEVLTEDQFEHIKQRLQLHRPYLLAVGTREPRKNLDRLIKAWQPLKSSVDLIIAGASGWDATDKLSHTPGLRLLGRVSDQELAVLYAEAEVFCYPSLYEGFGLPILEAFYHGTPVVTANTSAMPEVAGNAAELVDPLEVESIRQGIETILTESKPAQQRRLQQMLLRLHLFSWDRVAWETKEVYTASQTVG